MPEAAPRRHRVPAVARTPRAVISRSPAFATPVIGDLRTCGSQKKNRQEMQCVSVLLCQSDGCLTLVNRDADHLPEDGFGKDANAVFASFLGLAGLGVGISDDQDV